MDVIFLIVLPVVICLASAFFLGHWLRSHLVAVPLVLRALAAIISPSGLVVLYFWIWQSIDHARHVAKGGGDYMGQMTILVYGWPIIAAAALASELIAAYRFLES